MSRFALLGIAVPTAQMEAMISAAKVDGASRRAFLGKAAAAMLAALGVSTAGCDMPAPTGSRPDPPPPTEGIRPDRPPPRNADS